MFSVGISAEIIIYKTEGLSAVEVIGVDYGKRSIDYRTCSENRMACSPRLYSSFRHLEAGRKVVKLLVYIVSLKQLSCACLDVRLENFLEIPLDYEGNSSETCLISIVQGKSIMMSP